MLQRGPYGSRRPETAEAVHSGGHQLHILGRLNPESSRSAATQTSLLLNATVEITLKYRQNVAIVFKQTDFPHFLWTP